MRIEIKVFGRYKEITGKDTIQLDITDGNTLRDIINAFVIRYPSVKNDKTRIMIMKNKILSPYDTSFTQEDEITLTPPVVSGG